MNDVDIGLTQRGGVGVGWRWGSLVPRLSEMPILSLSQPATVIGHRSGPGPGPWKVVTLNYIMFYRERLQCIATNMYVCLYVCMYVAPIYHIYDHFSYDWRFQRFRSIEVDLCVFFFDMFLLIITT